VKAIVQDEYGAPEEVLALREIDKPAVADDEVLVRVRAAAVAGDDWHLMRGQPYVARMEMGLRRPKSRVPGRDLAGTVEAVGAEVEEFEPGEEVFGWCEGAFAEYASVPEKALAPKPANLTPEQAAVVPICGFTALQALRDKGEVQPGQSVLIVGASGGVGSFAVQIAKAFGAEVSGVCSGRNAELVRSLGADHVIDYTREDFARDGQRYELIVDLVGDRSLKDLRGALTRKGTLVMVGGTGGRWLKGTDRWLWGSLLSPFLGQRLRPLVHSDRKEDLLTLKALIEEGKLEPQVTARYPLSEASQAIAHYEAGHAQGKVVITV
jgi:NADPH:quinone reductase-like Zn-dependent oxidoreductase